MGYIVALNIILPWIFAFAINYFKNDFITNISTFLLLPILFILDVFIFKFNLPVILNTPNWINLLISVYDVGLLLYFLIQGINKKSVLVTMLALIQIVLLFFIFVIIKENNIGNIYIDRLTVLFYFIVAIVGIPIAIFSTKYMEYDEKRKHKFVAIIVWFLGVMNFAVSVNNIEWFFALFETTTLASYIMIGFRGDKEATNNAILALWMNQIGGIAILLALMIMIKVANIYHFTEIIKLHNPLIIISALGFLSLSALVKGAQLPFHKWLLGAMVAPTPVSAILHSATMVKIAPYLILRISPVIHNTLLSKLLIITTGFVFVVSSILALREVYFKRILAYSTISLLGLMMLGAAVGTPVSVVASLTLIVFHAFAKGFLFVEAGILEKVFHVKYISQMRRLIEKAPLTLMFIFFGFLNMTFVPFGSLIGKWFLIEEAANFLSHGSYIILILYVGAGSAFLSILYMKVLGISVRKSHNIEKVTFVPLPRRFNFVSVWYYLWLLTLAVFIAPFVGNILVSVAKDIVVGIYPIKVEGLSLILGNSTLYFWQIFIALIILILIHTLPYFVKLKNVDFVHPYNCGEIHKKYIETYDFACINIAKPYIIAFSIALFVLVVVLGGGLL